jgi:hypothetical protein
MADEITPWEDINPPMVSARPQGQLSTCSDHDARTVFRNELTACLALVAPVGMTEDSRREWLAVAWDTLRHIPPKDLASGARIARQTCDHPAKIVPAIIKAVEELRPWEKYTRSDPVYDRPQLESPDTIRCTPEEARQILDEVGIKRDWSGKTATT